MEIDEILKMYIFQVNRLMSVQHQNKRSDCLERSKTLTLCALREMT